MIDPATGLGVATALLVLLALLFWPGRGPGRRWLGSLRVTERVLLEDALKHLYDEEYRGRGANLNSVAGVMAVPLGRAAKVVQRLEGLGWVRSAGGALALTAEGRANALRVIRIHRLWERYLADHSGLEHMEWHERAERLEHTTTPEQAEALATRMGHPRFDPHGDPIPTAGGEIAPRRGQALNTLRTGETATVVHVEDEPAAVYAMLVAAGVQPGMRVDVLEVSGQRMRLGFDGDEHSLAPVVAGNVTVVVESAPEDLPTGDPLSDLKPGEAARVVQISRACHGPQRRRLLDLGLVPGTRVEAEFASPSGEPVAYRIRGALIALRREQAAMVQVQREMAA
jgi:DtxR family Mn-dependent transcriptional regulator